MTEAQAEAAVLAWVLATCDDIETGYDYPVGTKDGGLPDAIVVCLRKRRSTGRNEGSDSPLADLEQAHIRLFDMAISIMVELGQTEGETRTAHKALEAFGAELEGSMSADATLGGRVFATTPEYTFDYEQPFVEYGDGTRGRDVLLTMTVFELVPHA